MEHIINRKINLLLNFKYILDFLKFELNKKKFIIKIN